MSEDGSFAVQIPVLGFDFPWSVISAGYGKRRKKMSAFLIMILNDMIWASVGAIVMAFFVGRK